MRYLAEATNESLNTIASVMRELRIGIDINRSLDFEDAAESPGFDKRLVVAYPKLGKEKQNDEERI